LFEGILTANIQPEGLQVGDIVEVALTTEHRDPVMKDHVEAMLADFNSANLNQGHVRVQWPATLPIKLKATTGLPAFQVKKAGDRKEIEFSVSQIQPLVAPKGAPPRFAVGRLLDLTDFNGWSDLAELMSPYYQTASVIPPSGPLREEVEKIRASKTTDLDRAEAALSLVQDRIRYVALFMGQGGYMPAQAEQTWSRRFGDCKAKTALLLGILRELRIDAVPVLVNTNGGDGFDSRLPSARLFDHVLVLARVAGKEYWLDGTRSGDRRLQNISVPLFRWGLPLVKGAKLTPIMPAVADRPTAEFAVRIDAREGVKLPAPTKVDMVFRGSDAVDLNNLFGSATPQQRNEALRALFNKKVDDFDVESSSMAFDEATGEFRLHGEGKSKIDWDNDYYYSHASNLGFDPDFKRAAGTTAPDAPIVTNYPEYSKATETILLPPGFSKNAEPIKDLSETIAGVEYRRTASFANDVFTVEASERAIVPEVSYQSALADKPRLEKLSDNWLSIRIPGNYVGTEKELAQLASEKLTEPDDLNRRGYRLLEAWKFDEAIADFTAALAKEPDNALSLASRGIAYVWKKDYDKARRDLDAAEKRDPKQAVIFRAKGLMAQQTDSLPDAIAAYTTALQLEPKNSFSLGHRAEAFRASGDDVRALADSEAALKLEPNWGGLHLLRANIFMGQGKEDLAGQEADELRKSKSRSSFDLVAAANIYARVNRQKDSDDTYVEALAIKPEPFIYLNRALNRPRSDKAGRNADLDLALKLDPLDSSVLTAKAEALRDDGELKEALVYYSRAKATNPSDLYLRTQMAVLAYRLGTKEEAKSKLVEIRREAKAAPELNSLCWSKATAGILLESALEDCQEALRLSPNNGAYLDSLGMVLLRLGRDNEAVAAYDKAIAKNIGAVSLFGRAIAQSRQGRKAEAATDRAEALRKDPDIEARFKTFGLDFPSQ
jgi:tetratricopeptide (TPR) repeat protein